MALYYLTLTSHGAAALAAAQAGGAGIQITDLVLGDANGQPYQPDSAVSRTALVHECARLPVISVTADEDRVIVETLIPPETGGFAIHEIGLTDATGQLLYIGNWTGSYKPVLAEGGAGDMQLTIELMTSGLPTVIIPMDPSNITATRQWALDRFVLQTVHAAHVTQNTLEHNNLATLIAAVLLALQQHEAALDPHPQYALESEINPRHLFRFTHNTGSPYATSFGYSAGAVVHQLQGTAQSLGNCLNDYDAIEVQPVAEYEVEGITLGGGINRQGFLLRFDGYIQFGNYAGQGDTGFTTPTVKLLLLDDAAQTLVEIPLTITLIAGGFPNNGAIGQATFRISKDFDLYNLRKTNGQLPPLLYAALSATGTSDSDGGSTDLQILTIEGFSILCSY